MLAMTLCSCKFVKSKEPAEETAGKNTTTTTAKTSTTESEVGVPDEESEDFTIYVTDANGEYITNKDGSKKTEVFKVDELEENPYYDIQRLKTVQRSEEVSSGSSQRTGTSVVPVFVLWTRSDLGADFRRGAWEISTPQ